MREGYSESYKLLNSLPQKNARPAGGSLQMITSSIKKSRLNPMGFFARQLRPLLLGIGMLLIPLVLTPLFARAAAKPICHKSYNALLQSNWQQYKDTFIQPDGRVIDHNQNISTSEGQAYAMLRSVWVRDRSTFDKTYLWAKQNLQQHRTDHLFSWRWGKRDNGAWGSLDETVASDADQDIALALILYHHIWPTPVYLKEAKLILHDFWEQLVLKQSQQNILLPGQWANTPEGYQLNPSYFAPYAYRVFAEADSQHDWISLVSSSYNILQQATLASKTHLPPDWVVLPVQGKTVLLYEDPLDERSDFGYEAIRVYWRVAMDLLLMPDNKEAKALLKMNSELTQSWKREQKIPVSVAWDGVSRNKDLQSGSLYGATLPGFYWHNQQAARKIVERDILPNLEPNGKWNTQADYYSQNWLWFGLALFSKLEHPLQGNSKQSVTERMVEVMSLEAIRP
jgi:endoglucanase